MTICVDYAKQHSGFKRPPDGLDQKTCPKCGAETVVSFGLLGGGYGPYVICAGRHVEVGDDTPDCNWFYKLTTDPGPGPTGRQRTRARWRRTGRR
jgi:hypothetical protein